METYEHNTKGGATRGCNKGCVKEVTARQGCAIRVR